MSKLLLFLFTFGFIFLARFEDFTIIFQKLIVPITFLILLIKNRNSFTKIGILSLYIIFLILASTSFIHSINIERTLRFFQIMVGAFMFLSIYTLILTRNPMLLSAISFGFVVSAIFIILFMDIQSEDELGKRAMGVTSNPNIFGMFMLYGVFGVSLLWKEANLRLKYLLTSLVFLFLYGIIASASRKSLVSVGFFISLWGALLFFSEKNVLKTFYFIVPFLAISYFLYNIFYLDSTMMFRMEYVQESGEGRYDIALEGFKMFKSSPLIGVGLGTFQEYSDSEKYAHNDFFELIATLGLFGLLIYVSIYYWLIKTIRIVKKITHDNNIIYRLNIFLAIIATMIMLGLGRPNFFDTFSMSIFGIMAGYTLGIGLKINEINED